MPGNVGWMIRVNQWGWISRVDTTADMFQTWLHFTDPSSIYTFDSYALLLIQMDLIQLSIQSDIQSTFWLDTINYSCVLRLYCLLPLQTITDKITDRHTDMGFAYVNRVISSLI